jgi:SAM-dependent methyltransferase
MSAFERLGITPKKLFDHQKKYSIAQDQTRDTFAFKWSKRETYESEAVLENARRWLFERYCGNDPDKLEDWLHGSEKIILDAGCGSGFSALLFFRDYLKKHDYLGVDISDAIEVAKERFQEEGYSGDFLKTDILDLPVPDESIDLVFSEGVLHHTDDVESSIRYLTKKLKKGGYFLFYVYAKKAVIREFTDDHIRGALATMSHEDAWEALKPLTKLGIALGKLDAEIDIPEDIPFLEIKKGKQNLQRFFYWNICKAFFNPAFSFEEMNHINFDWFRPLNCSRHTKEEVVSYCKEAGLMIENMNSQEAGFTVVAYKR